MTESTKTPPINELQELRSLMKRITDKGLHTFIDDIEDCKGRWKITFPKCP